MLAAPLLALMPLQQFHCTETQLPSTALQPVSGESGLSLSGDLAVVASAPPGFAIQELATFEREAGVWSYRSTLSAPQDPSSFARDRDLEGSSLLVAEPQYTAPSGQGRGRILTYTWNSSTDEWVLGQAITDPFGGPRRFGNPFARDGEWLAAFIESPHPQIGLPLLMYRRDGSGAWAHSQTIQASAPGFSGFRGALQLCGTTLVAEDSSGLRVFRLAPNGQWADDGPLPPTGTVIGDVQLLEDELLVASLINGGERILRIVRDGASGAWTLAQAVDTSFFPSGFNSFQLREFAASENLLLVGQREFSTTRTGRLLRYERDPVTSDWVPVDALDRGAGQIPFERLGSQVALDGTTALVSSNSQLLTFDQVYVAELSTSDCNGNGVDDACELLDPGQDRNGDGILDPCQLVGTVYCTPANVNSTGAASRIGALGSDALADASLDIVVDRLPAGQFGYLLASSAPGFVANVAGSSGNLCLGGGPDFGRYTDQIGNSGAAGVVLVQIDVPQVTTSVGPRTLVAGDSWYFQYWNRDGLTSNHSPGLEVLFQ